jgi:thiol-disulfide isomerase/thioredoxin
MSTSGSLTKHPTLLTAVLSVAALAGYVAYRFTLGAAEPAAEGTTAAVPLSDHTHEPAPLADSLPDLLLEDLAGTPTPLASLAGQPLLINFWATWCAPCLREIPLLKTLHAEDPSIRVVGIAYDRRDDVLEYAENTMEFTYPVLGFQTAAFDAMTAFHNDAQVMPFSVLIAADGATLGTFAGELHEEDLENLSAAIADLTAGRIDRQTARERVAGLR